MCQRPSSYSQPGTFCGDLNSCDTHFLQQNVSRWLAPALSLRNPTSHVKMQYFQVCIVLAINIIGISLKVKVYLSSEDDYILNLCNEIK